MRTRDGNLLCKPSPQTVDARIIHGGNFRGANPASSKVNRRCDRVAISTLTDTLSSWDTTIDRHRNILVVRRVLDEVGLSSSGAIPPNDRPGCVQIQVVIQRLASLKHPPRIE